MLILLMVTAAAIPIVAPAMQNRRMRESARLVSSYFSVARSRAIETGRPVGVVIERFNGQPFGMVLSQVEVPPTYAGDIVGATCDVLATAMPNLPSSDTHFNEHFNTSTTTARWFTASVSNINFNARLVRVGDQIQFGGQGPLYTILGPDELPTAAGDGVIDDSATINLDVAYVYPSGTTPAVYFPWNGTPPPTSYQIIRQPTRSSTAPLQLPEGIVVDLVSSGLGAGGTFNVANLSGPTGSTPFAPVVPFDPLVLFSPSGRLETVSQGLDGRAARPTDAVYLLLGRRELMYDVTAKMSGEDIVDRNLSDVPNPTTVTPAPPAHFWVTIGYQTGLVTVTEVAANFQDYAPSSPLTFQIVVQNALTSARLFARQSQSVGGR